MLSPLRIGPLALETPILLAPMAGYTDLPLRLSLRRQGGIGLAFAEMLNDHSILVGNTKRRASMLGTTPEDSPLGHQIYGTDPATMAAAARWLQDHGAILIDINMGCPQRKIASKGAGAGLLKKPALAARITEAVVSAVSIPVTAKLRLGWDESSPIAADLAKTLVGIGVSAITVHGRTRAQGFSGETNLDGIRRVVEAVPEIPVIGNGDVKSPEEALRMVRETGCAGIMVARGAMANPWLIRDAWQALQGLPPLPRPTRAEDLALLREHFEATVNHYGEEKSAVLFRRWIPRFWARVKLPRPEMLPLFKISDCQKMRQALAEITVEEAAA